MNTQDLIEQLAHDSTPMRASASRRLLQALLTGGLVCGLLLVAVWGINPELGRMLGNPVFTIKMLWLAGLMGWSAYGWLRLARPGMGAGHTWIALGLCLLTMIGLGLASSLSMPADGPAAPWLGSSWKVCSVSIAALALPLLLTLLWGLGQLAPTRPALAGAAAGALAGSVAASFYSLHCTETGLGFFAIWYVAGMASVTALGALLGPRCLRW